MAIRTRSRTVRSVLALFALCLIVPAVVAVGLLVASNVFEVRRSKEAELLAVAQSASKTVDLKMTRLAAISSALATSDVVTAGDWPAARARIARLELGSDAWVAVTDKHGRRLLNTNPAATSAPSAARPRAPGVAAAAKSEHPLFSNLFVGSSTGRKVVSVDQGVVGSADEVVVTVVAEPAGLMPTATEVSLPGDAIVTIVDRDHRVIARSRNHARWQGAYATAPMSAALRQRAEGVVAMTSLDDRRTAVAFKTSPMTGWTTMVVVPREAITEPALNNGVAFALIGAALLTMGLALSHYFGSGLIDNLHRLEEDAAEIGHGRLVLLRPTGIENIDRVQAALSEASNELDVRASRQRLMINELNHRVKNTLATVQALAVQTFRSSNSDAPAKFDQRLIALAQAHDLLTQTSWQPVDIRTVVERCVRPQSANIDWSGPSAVLPAQSAVALCMCLHELLTNAMKYGALSVADGRVAIEWSFKDDQSIALDWHESGGPYVEPTARRGFGTKLIERLAHAELHGSFTRRFASGGLEAKLTIAAPESRSLDQRLRLAANRERARQNPSIDTLYPSHPNDQFPN